MCYYQCSKDLWIKCFERTYNNIEQYSRTVRSDHVIRFLGSSSHYSDEYADYVSAHSGKMKSGLCIAMCPTVAVRFGEIMKF